MRVLFKKGSIYFGKEDVTAVKCVVIIQKLAKNHSWFTAFVKDVRMLRIEENNDLMEAIQL